jgi:hypothetical protein
MHFDAEVLNELTKADLKQLGVLLGVSQEVGEGKLTILARLRLEEPRANRAKRRQLTVKFCDLVEGAGRAS